MIAQAGQEEVASPSSSPVAGPILGLPLAPAVAQGHLDLQADAVAAAAGKRVAEPDASVVASAVVPTTP